MALIGVGFIGLSAGGGSWGASAHLPYLKESSKYKITGVCNSSTESSQKAIDAYGFSAHAKAYGSVAEMAASSDIHLVICCVRVDRHYDSIKPVLEAGKDCFVEWPLASNLQQATELLEIAERKGVKTMIGLQGQKAPVITRVKELIEKENAIGRVTASHLNLAGMLGGRETPEPREYLEYIETGGSMLVIPFGHLYDSISYALGEFAKVSSTLSIQHRDIPITSSDGKVIKTVQRTTADHITMSGLLTNGAHSSAQVSGGLPFPGSPALKWRIEGDKGVIEVRGEQVFAISMSADPKIRFQDFETGKVKDIEVKNDTPGPSGNVGRLYEAFADGQGYPDWKWAVKRHAWVDALYKSSETGKSVSYV